MFVGEAGLEPTMTDPNSVVLPITPFPIKNLLLLSQVSEEK